MDIIIFYLKFIEISEYDIEKMRFPIIVMGNFLGISDYGVGILNF